MSAIPQTDRTILRELGRHMAAAAADPVNDERREICRRIENHERGRPSVFIYQEPWSELNLNGELDLLCQDGFCREIEEGMRRCLYKWRHFPGDMTISAVSVQPHCVYDSGFGIETDAETVRADPAHPGIAGTSRYRPQIRDEADIARIQVPVVTHDARKTETCYQKRAEIFAGILDVQKRGGGRFWYAPWDDFPRWNSGIWFAPWDMLVQWTGVQEVLMDMALRPAYVHKAISRLVDCWLACLDRYEEQNLLCAPTRDLLAAGAAQIFSEVSPAMHREFALEHEARFFRRFGRVYYGCCEPLHAKVDICAECLPNLYKISMSPWVNFPEAVRNVRDRFVFAWKPHPAFLACDRWDPDQVRADIRSKLTMAVAAGCSVEIHLKDITTVRNEPWRLTEWERIAKEEAARVVA